MRTYPFFLIGGLPSGKTSVIARMFEAMGVNMGESLPQGFNDRRPYELCECRELYAIMEKTPLLSRVSEYVEHRLSVADGQPQGAKNTHLGLLGFDPSIRPTLLLPNAVFVRVIREPEPWAALESDRKYRSDVVRRRRTLCELHVGLSRMPADRTIQITPRSTGNSLALRVATILRDYGFEIGVPQINSAASIWSG